jgi:hypothetical protein
MSSKKYHTYVDRFFRGILQASTKVKVGKAQKITRLSPSPLAGEGVGEGEYVIFTNTLTPLSRVRTIPL